MKNCDRMAIVFAAASLCFAQAPAPQAGQAPAAQAPPPVALKDPAADPKAKAVAEARAKRNAQDFENFATVITLYDRSGKSVGSVG